MNYILDNPSKYLSILLFLYFIFIPRFCNMSSIEKNKFFNILSKSQLLSIFFLLIISAVNLNNNSNLINLSYIYFIITINIMISIIVYYLKLDDLINNALKKYIGNNFIKNMMVVFYAVILIVYLFFPKFTFIAKHAATILTIVLSLNVLSIKYIDESFYNNSNS